MKCIANYRIVRPCSRHNAPIAQPVAHWHSYKAGDGDTATEADIAAYMAASAFERFFAKYERKYGVSDAPLANDDVCRSFSHRLKTNGLPHCVSTRSPY